MVCLHGFTDTWRTWELVLPRLQRDYDVLAPTLLGHAGGPPLDGDFEESQLIDAVEQAMDDAGFETAHIVGNSLGGYVALQLAARGRATSVVALAPAGGWAEDDDTDRQTQAYFTTMLDLVAKAAPHAEEIAATVEGRRRATFYTATNFEHIPAALVAHQIRGAAHCRGAPPMIDYMLRKNWNLDAERVRCPVRIVWGTEDKILTWPSAAVRFQDEWLPHADWVELPDVGHCPQLDVPLETAELITSFTGSAPERRRGQT
jgi:pimeloyl-ACP methyl ester carboxylesterase